ncbi:hypothetical protein L7F22_044794 [Adiantum nelumboides]|nr:hypothetical protein [Adiantum nelumboides]
MTVLSFPFGDVMDDAMVIATVCMFLAGKVEETPKLLQYVISVAWEIRHKKDLDMVQRLKSKEVYEQEKELVLIGERLVLATLGFDLNIYHPYKPLVTAIKKMRVAQNSLAQVAWNFVNDGYMHIPVLHFARGCNNKLIVPYISRLRTSLCLQFKAHHIAAGAIFLAAKFLKVKLPSNDKRPWWQEFDVSPRQLEEVSNQMLELYEQHRELPASRAADSSATRASSIPPGTPQEVYEQEKELVLIGERLVLATLGFDMNIHHPYKPLVIAIKKLRVAQNSLAQIAWNFVNDGLRTSLCLQFKAHHIAAGAIFLAAKFLKVKLPSNDKRPWWQEFDVSPRQLEEVSNQMLELYEQHRELPASRAADSSATRASAISPGTPQVAEKRPGVELKARIAPEPTPVIQWKLYTTLLTCLPITK